MTRRAPREYPEASQYKPTTPGIRRVWQALHRQHIRELRLMDAGGVRWYVHASTACKLADAKYDLYLRDCRVRSEIAEALAAMSQGETVR